VSLLTENEVDIGQQMQFGDGDDEVDDAEVELEEIEEEVFDEAQDKTTRKKQAVNYTEIEDTCLVRAWSQVCVDAVTGTDQTGKRYWQRIEDKFFKLMPRVAQPVYRSYRSLQGRWDVIKPVCSRWCRAMAQVQLNPPSGITTDEYVRSLFNSFSLTK